MMFICLLVMLSKALSRFCFRLQASLTCGGLSGDKIYEYLLVSSCLNSIRSIVYCCCRIDNFLLNGNRFACHSPTLVEAIHMISFSLRRSWHFNSS